MPHFIMNQLPCWISILGLFLSLTVCKCRALTIYGFEGQDVTLPCKYDSRYHGICDICWMRGNIPNNGCGNQIIYANDKAVVSQDSVRYQLNGALQKGEASLTILNARKSDSGKYGCRVHVPGWFNDKKIVVYLEIREAPQRTTTTLEHTTNTQVPTHAPVPTTQHETTTIPEHVTTQHTAEQTDTMPEYITTTALIPTKEPVITTQAEMTTSPEQSHAETQQTLSSLGYVTTAAHTVTHEPVITTQAEKATSPEQSRAGPDLTTQDETTTTPEYVTPKHTAVISEMYPDASSPENDKFVNEDTIALPAILVPVIVIFLFLGIVAVYLMSKHERRFRETLEIAKNSSTSVNYSHLDSSVILPMTNSSNN